jgi:hypothetical protein
MGIHKRPAEFPRHPEFNGYPLLVGDEVQLDNWEGGQWYVICEIKSVGYGFDGTRGKREVPPEIWITVLGHLSTVIYPSSVLARRSRSSWE